MTGLVFHISRQQICTCYSSLQQKSNYTASSFFYLFQFWSTQGKLKSISNIVEVTNARNWPYSRGIIIYPTVIQKYRNHKISLSFGWNYWKWKQYTSFKINHRTGYRSFSVHITPILLLKLYFQ